MQQSDTPKRLFYSRLALLALTVAAWTGVLMRFGFTRGFPTWAANYMAVRHAHSHLMYFGWVTLGLMAMIWTQLPRITGKPLPRLAAWQMAASAVAALLSFPAFWANGYGLTAVGNAQLPLGSMAATLNGLTWYGFALLYVQATRSVVVRPLPLKLWDGAVALMTLSTLGAVGLAVLVARDVDSMALYQLFLHLFLDLFAAGWFTLALLGVLWGIQNGEAHGRGLPTGALTLALIPTFLLGMSPAVVGPAMYWVAAVANLMAAVLLGRHLVALWRQSAEVSALERFALICLGIHLAIALALLWPGVWRWANGTQLRVFYLHNFLLGWVSSGLLAVLLRDLPGIQPNWRRVISGIWIVGVAVMLVALLGLGLVSVLPLPALLMLRLAAWSSVLPAVAALLAFALSCLPTRAAR